jgi:hypothetical protein
MLGNSSPLGQGLAGLFGNLIDSARKTQERLISAKLNLDFNNLLGILYRLAVVIIILARNYDSILAFSTFGWQK